MSAPQVVQELKRDVFGRIELLDGEAGLLVRRVACGSRVPGSRWLAHVLMRRERRTLLHLDGRAGVARLVDREDYASVPSLGGTVPRRRDVLLRSWVEGTPLYAASELPEDFFDRLEDLVRLFHGHGVCHNDVHKEPNVLVRPDGYPALIDFQLSSVHRKGGARFEARCREDLGYVEKHRRTYLRGAAGGSKRSGRKKERSPLSAFWMRFGKPIYNLVTRRLLRREGGEPRRGREGPWPEWIPPVGPR